MSWTTANIKLNDNQTQIRDFDINGFIVWRGPTSINWSQLGTSTI